VKLAVAGVLMAILACAFATFVVNAQRTADTRRAALEAQIRAQGQARAMQLAAQAGRHGGGAGYVGAALVRARRPSRTAALVRRGRLPRCTMLVFVDAPGPRRPSSACSPPGQRGAPRRWLHRAPATGSVSTPTARRLRRRDLLRPRPRGGRSLPVDAPPRRPRVPRARTRPPQPKRFRDPKEDRPVTHVSLTVNGAARAMSSLIPRLLLREQLGPTGTNVGCDTSSAPAPHLDASREILQPARRAGRRSGRRRSRPSRRRELSPRRSRAITTGSSAACTPVRWWRRRASKRTVAD
jgi:hypothetical protein